MVNAVELSVDAAWFIAEEMGNSNFPWVLAITPPYRDGARRDPFTARQVAELTRIGVMTSGSIDPSVRQWIQTACRPDRWLDLRYIRGDSSQNMLRGILAHRGGETVMALRNAGLVTFTPLEIEDPYGLGAAVTAVLERRPPAHFGEFAIPARAGARADARLRAGADLSTVMGYLGVPQSARPVVETALDTPDGYVEIVAGQRDPAGSRTTEVGVAVVDSSAGRVVVSPCRGFDGQWISNFAPGSEFAVARALENLTATLPDGRWFPAAQLAREFTSHAS